MRRQTATVLLIAATFFWGMAFIAQKSAMDAMGPLTFIAARYIIGGLLILPVAIYEYRRSKVELSARQWLSIGFLCLNFFLASWLQQWGLATTSVTNGGFLTGLYVFFVPIILLVVFRTKPHPIVWICSPVAFLGLYFLSGASIDPFGQGDLLVVSSAIFWAMQVLLLGFLAAATGLPIFISAISFLVAGFIALGGAAASETITLAILGAGWVEIAYAALFSTAIGFTLQAMGQRYVPPANAAIIMSGESIFAALGGALILGERLNGSGYLGAGLLFVAIVMVETIPALKGRARVA
ncbi:Permease of the drug/metabolite transporter (DMT) superfamily [hydrothermal vent metagenome]|uniref:Permease of the drug/metabolite transporter (DMT) superfamily n=1 Tax=hydrothermal vent metagenome TaxID=652676 RepID=A0A3B0TLQ6_9ZZZZ